MLAVDSSSAAWAATTCATVAALAPAPLRRTLTSIVVAIILFAVRIPRAFDRTAHCSAAAVVSLLVAQQHRLLGAVAERRF